LGGIMAKHPHQVDIGPVIVVTRSYAKILAGASGVLETVQYKSDNPAVGSATFDIKLNGVSIYASPTDRPVIPNGGVAINVDLAAALSLVPNIVKGDTFEFLVELSGGAIGGNLYTQITVEDQLTPFYGGTSATSETIGGGDKVFTTQRGLGYVTGSRVRLASLSNPTVNYMEGIVTSYTGTTFAVTVDLISGTGVHTDWQLSIAGNTGPPGPTGAPGPVGPTGPAGAAGGIQTIVPGTGIHVDASDPDNPVVSSTSTGGGGGGAGVDSPPDAPSIYNDEFDAPIDFGRWDMQSDNAGFSIDSGVDPAKSWLNYRSGPNPGKTTLSQAFPMGGSGDFTATIKFVTDGVQQYQGFQWFIENSVSGAGYRWGLYAGSNGSVLHAFPAFTILDQGHVPILMHTGYWHIQRRGGSWEFYSSYNGIAWQKHMELITTVINIDRMRLSFDQSGAASVYHAAVDWVRVNWLYL
jgi:hypothetical protein